MENLEKNKQDQFLHNLIQKEFREILSSEEYKLPSETQSVIVLSAADFEENKIRVGTGVEIIKEIIAKKLGKHEKDISADDILKNAPQLVLNGTPEQLSMMKRAAEEMRYPLEKIDYVDCGENGNTKTQFEEMNKFYSEKNPNHVIFVTSDYHAPRVARTGYKNFNPNINFDIVPTLHSKHDYNVFRIIRAEAKKILKYSAKGDIIKDIPKKK